MFCVVAPHFITQPQSVEAFIGAVVNLSCSADGFPAPDIMWLFEGMTFTNDTVDNTNTTYAESTIVITDLMLSHGGTYTCDINSTAIVMSRSSSAAVAVIGGKINRHICVVVLFYITLS